MEVNRPCLSTINTLEYYLKYWQYGHNYEDSTILVDPSMNIIAFFDRGTECIDVISCEHTYRGTGIYECLSNKKGEVKVNKLPSPTKIKYTPIYVHRTDKLRGHPIAIPYRERIKEIKTAKYDDDKEKYLTGLVRISCYRHIKYEATNYLSNLKKCLSTESIIK